VEGNKTAGRRESIKRQHPLQPWDFIPLSELSNKFGCFLAGWTGLSRVFPVLKCEYDFCLQLTMLKANTSLK
jgi:hypothetical protein